MAEEKKKGSRLNAKRLKAAVRTGKKIRKIAAVAVPVLNAVSVLILRKFVRDD